MSGLSRRMLCRMLLVSVSLALWCATATGQLLDPNQQGEVGLEPQLGQSIDLDLTFYDEAGQPVTLRELMDRPTVLTLVYYRCPGICTPLLNALSEAVNKLDLELGTDYRMVTISFDPRERDIENLAKNKQSAMLGTLDIEADQNDWRFLTGEADAIDALTKSVGFKYVPAQEDFTHVGTVIFLTKAGKIVSYLDGGAKIPEMGSGEPKPRILPMEMKLAIMDATTGRPRNLMKKIQSLCFSYDAQSKGYVVAANRIILGVTFVFVAGFGGALLFWKGKKNQTPVMARASEGRPVNNEGRS